MPFTLENTLLPRVSGSINNSLKEMKNHGQSLSTGINQSAGPVARFLGDGLMGTAQILNSIQKTTNYAQSALQIASSYLSSIQKAITDAQATLASAEGVSAENLSILNDTLVGQIDQVERLILQCKFDNRALLNGELSNNDFRSSLPNYGHEVVYAGGVQAHYADDGNGDNSGAKSAYTVTFNNGNAAPGVGASDGDKLTIKGAAFTFRSANNYTGVDGEVLIGTTVAETAQNFAKVFNQSGMLHPQLHRFTVDTNHAATNVVTITSRNDHVPLNGTTLYEQGNPNIAAIAIGSADGNAGALEIDAPTAEKFIGKNTPVFTVVASAETANGGSEASDLINAHGLADVIDARNTLANKMAADANGDGAAVLQCTVGDEIYRAPIFVANGGDTNNYYIRFESTTTDSAFIVKTAAAAVPDLQGGGGNAAANSLLICNSLNTLFSTHVEVLQTRRVDINTNLSGIKDADSFVKGMTVNLTSNDFTGKKFESFEVKEDVANPGQYIVYSTISGEKYQSASLTPAHLIGQKLIEVPSLASPNHKLTINVGNKDWTTLADNATTISTQVSKAVNIGTGLKVSLGTGADAKMNVNISNLSRDKLFVNENGQTIKDADLNIMSDDAKTRTEGALERASNKIRREIANISNMKQSIEDSSKALQQSITATEEAAADMIKTDYIIASQELSQEIKKASAAGAVLGATNQMTQLAIEMVRNA